MTPRAIKVLCEPVLVAAGISHGFGQRASQVPDFTIFPKQVHGVAVVEAIATGGAAGKEGDAILTALTGQAIGIVTADCVPILAAASDGSVVAAIHAGWRGLAAGVIEAGIEALRLRSGGSDLVCAVGPAARGCCYEVDDPVRDCLDARYRNQLDEALEPSSAGHYQLDLSLLATRVLERSGIDPARIGTEHRVCTICDPDRFESYRRDGSAAGRLRHFISIPVTIPRQG